MEDQGRKRGRRGRRSETSHVDDPINENASPITLGCEGCSDEGGGVNVTTHSGDSSTMEGHPSRFRILGKGAGGKEVRECKKAN